MEEYPRVRIKNKQTKHSGNCTEGVKWKSMGAGKYTKGVGGYWIACSNCARRLLNVSVGVLRSGCWSKQ